MMLLTVGLAGAQLAWTVEMAFGTPYLLSLGLSKQSTSLVWLAGPLSGLLVQPVVGAISDSSSSPYRRRQFILLSTLLILTSTLFVAYAREIAQLLAGLTGLGDWDPKTEESVAAWAVVIGVSGFWVLDFGLNGLQASLRALILDRTPPHQQPTANAWHGRQTHLGNILGYSFGYLNLGRSPLLSWVGGGQFRKLAVVACCVMAVTVGVTCVTQTEEVRVGAGGGEGVGKRLRAVVKGVRDSLRDLPLPVRRVCYVQVFSWTAWFPFLFYSTTYISEILRSSLPPTSPPPSSDEATRAGSLALLLYALVALAAGSILPLLSTLGRREWVDRWVSRSSRKGRAMRRVMAGLSPRNWWTVGLGVYAMGMVATFWVRDVRGAMWVVAGLGVPWAITCWVPFALVMESIRTLQLEQQSRAPPPPSHQPRYHDYSTPSTPTRASATRPLVPPQPFRATTSTSTAPSPTTARSNAQSALNECSPLLPGPRSPAFPAQGEEEREGQGAEAGGTILGIHNLSIVAPQFLVALISAGIFKLLELGRSAPSSSFLASLADPSTFAAAEPEATATNDVVWVLRFGGLAAAMGCVVSRWVLETPSERAYKEWVLREPDEDEYEGEEGSEGSVVEV
ncbi:hypothetical protein BCR35DRAFT_280347 [Leucosporidium creatinivorum]|uniref:Major facilitator superfamily domain-containing protein n=1 Tax=Leucosporidium creatinivorum TaxID=106004 RepID=A0A1Y2EY09_9BASI|nr:hypothetical protein BCR35DRAFT_280347 [Leucosporidium creatinivorum]